MKPIKPLFQPSKASKHEFAMFQDLRRRYSWVLPIYRYQDLESLLASLQEKVIVPAEQKVKIDIDSYDRLHILKVPVAIKN